MRVLIQYVDRSVTEIDPHEWATAPGAGVDTITIRTATGDCVLANHSLYWCYRDGLDWVFGSGSHYDPHSLTEILIAPDGVQTERQIPYMPDLNHAAVKLGHWWLGTSAPCEGRP